MSLRFEVCITASKKQVASHSMRTFQVPHGTGGRMLNSFPVIFLSIFRKGTGMAFLLWLSTLSASGSG